MECKHYFHIDLSPYIRVIIYVRYLIEPPILLPIKNLVKTQRSYLHSALGYRTPIQAEDEYYKNHNSHLNAA